MTLDKSQEAPGFLLQALGKVIKKHHMRHHFMGEDGNFGVTTPLWDHVLDTRIGSAGRASAKAMRELPVHPAE